MKSKEEILNRVKNIIIENENTCNVVDRTAQLYAIIQLRWVLGEENEDQKEDITKD